MPILTQTSSNFEKRREPKTNPAVYFNRDLSTAAPCLTISFVCSLRADVAELADAPDSKSGGRKAVWVRAPPSVPSPLGDLNIETHWQIRFNPVKNELRQRAKAISIRRRKPPPTPWQIGKRLNYCDAWTGYLIYLSILFGPWALGSVHAPAIWTMNVIGYLLGFLLLGKTLLLLSTESRPAKAALKVLSDQPPIIRILMLATIGILAYTFLHAFNARSVFDSLELRFDYFNSYIHWLPHSYNAPKSWQAFWQLLALSCSFWAVRSWLLTPGKSERRQGFQKKPSQKAGFPKKLQAVLYLLSINAALIGFIGIIHKLDGSRETFWVYEPVFLQQNSNFGTFNYWGNAATYFNLLGTVCLFLLINIKKHHIAANPWARIGSAPHLLLYPVLVILVISPLVTGSRSGPIIFAVAFCFIAIYLFIKSSSRRKLILSGLPLLLLIGFGAFYMGADLTLDRLFKQTFKHRAYNAHTPGDRLDIYQSLWRMAQDCSPWGAGPGAFASIYQMYRKPALEVAHKVYQHRNDELVSWAAWAHCDPLEFLITYGPAGTAILSLGLASVFMTPLSRRKKLIPVKYIGLLYLSPLLFIANSLIDFPFQIYSLAHHFIIICAILSSVKPAS